MALSILLGEGDIRTKLITLGILIIVMIISFSFHEWAHAHAAHRNGDDTAKNLGRMTLNPAAHIDPIGFLLLMFVGFGWAKPVPVNPRNYRHYRRAEFQVSLAGIFTNIVIALISAFLYVALWIVSARTQREITPFVFLFVELLGIINVSLAVFNFIPVFPLDGSHLFDLIFGRRFPRAVMWMHNNGRFILYGIFGLIFILGRVFGISPLGWVTEKIYTAFIDLFWLIGKNFV